MTHDQKNIKCYIIIWEKHNKWSWVTWRQAARFIRVNRSLPGQYLFVWVPFVVLEQQVLSWRGYCTKIGSLDVTEPLWGTASNSNIEILQRFQNKVLRSIVNAPWYVPNTLLHTDLQRPTVRGEFRPRQTRQLPRAVDLKGRLLSCQSY